jgi:N-acetylglutamate synthase-like GNAT family acetyltransferase
MTKDNNEIIIRKFQANDLPHIISLFIKGMNDSKASDSYIQQSLKDDLSNIENTYFVGRGTFLVIERVFDSMVIGCAGLQDLALLPQHYSGHAGENFCELRRMSIHTEERRKGYGEKIMGLLISEAKSSGFDGITLFTGSWMHHAINFYKKIGFEHQGDFEFNDQGKIIVTTHLTMHF